MLLSKTILLSLLAAVYAFEEANPRNRAEDRLRGDIRQNEGQIRGERQQLGRLEHSGREHRFDVEAEEAGPSNRGAAEGRLRGEIRGNERQINGERQQLGRLEHGGKGRRLDVLQKRDVEAEEAGPKGNAEGRLRGEIRGNERQINGERQQLGRLEHGGKGNGRGRRLDVETEEAGPKGNAEGRLRGEIRGNERQINGERQQLGRLEHGGKGNGRGRRLDVETEEASPKGNAEGRLRGEIRGNERQINGERQQLGRLEHGGRGRRLDVEA